jgi:hypothetical protein
MKAAPLGSVTSHDALVENALLAAEKLIDAPAPCAHLSAERRGIEPLLRLIAKQSGSQTHAIYGRLELTLNPTAAIVIERSTRPRLLEKSGLSGEHTAVGVVAIRSPAARHRLHAVAVAVARVGARASSTLLTRSAGRA